MLSGFYWLHRWDKKHNCKFIFKLKNKARHLISAEESKCVLYHNPLQILLSIKIAYIYDGACKCWTGTVLSSGTYSNACSIILFEIERLVQLRNRTFPETEYVNGLPRICLNSWPSCSQILFHTTLISCMKRPSLSLDNNIIVLNKYRKIKNLQDFKNS